MTPQQIAAQLIAICHAGFRNEHQHRNWLRKHWAAVSALPDSLRDAVLVAHANATHKDFSGAPKEGS